jgi:hypothetical protein
MVIPVFINILKECKLPVTVQLMNTTNHDIQLEGKMVLLTGVVKLSLEKEYEEKYMYGNTVKWAKGKADENKINNSTTIDWVTIHIFLVMG